VDQKANNNLLSLWTIYDHPADYPDAFVARRFVVGLEDVPVATTDVIVAETIEALRERFLELGLVAIERALSDEPQIVETWL
jgi:hypothetical protein